MSTPTPDARRKCPDCQAVLDPGAEFCWLCRRDLRVQSEQAAEAPQEMPAAAVVEEKPMKQRAPLQFSLAAVLLVTTVVAIVLSAFVILPGLGIALVILLTPPLVRTWLSTERAQAGGTPLSANAKGRIFAITLGVLITSGIAAAISFYALCWGAVGVGFGVDQLTGSQTEIGVGSGALVGFAIGILLGIVAGIIVFILVIRRLWRRFF
jgi:hypothetical protein